MPCRICKLIGHNSRTCKQKDVENNDIIDIVDNNNNNDTIVSNKKYYCYILQQINKNNSLNYVGYTVNYNRRIRQHNGIIKGGAFYTKNKGPWQFLAVMTCSSWNNIRALQVEWLIKHPTRKRKRQKRFSGSPGKIESLVEIFKRIPQEEKIHIFIDPNFHKSITELNLPCNVVIFKNLNDI